MIPIVTVTYSCDKWQMLLQAHSIEKFVEEPTTHYVIIEDDKISFLEWRCLLEPIYKKHKLVILNQENCEEIFPKHPTTITSGYIKQQFLKLTSCILTDEPFLLILDSKNVFFKPINLYKEFYGEGGGSTEIVKEMRDYEEIIKYYSKWIETLDSFFNGLKPKYIYFPCTPFVLDVNLIKKFLRDTSLQAIFEKGLENGSRISEFILYSYIANIQECSERFWGFGNNFNEDNDFFKNHVNNRLIFAIFRPTLENTNNRYNTSNFLMNCGLEERYVIPAVYLTSIHNR